jgi:hypothetical protein
MANALNMDVVRRRRAELAREAEERENGAHFDKLKEGQNRRRILPPWSSEGNWRKRAAYHYNIVDKKSLVCLKKTFNQNCPICEYVDGLYKTNTPESKEEAKKYRAKDRFFANVLNLDANDGKVYVMAFGPQLEESIIDEMDGGQKDGQSGSDSFGVGDITHPKTGRNMLITKDVPPGKKEQTSYKAKASGTPSEVANFANVEKQLHDLDALVQKDVYSYDELKSFLMGESTPAERTEKSAPGNTQQSTPAPSGGVTDEFENAAPKDEFGQTEQPAATTPPAEPAKPAAGGSALDRLRGMKKK